ncbi:FAD-dependent oxidoreductase [Agrococcus lahaulensis]|uniref:FAD-dependent oxidoreductase n=1 Tax=Agrococcus lahaulensis TaxID=341722 RepID=UPI00047EE688|nr:FAD-dependent oxidoreductase [Agrococcus lahaulensis]
MATEPARRSADVLVYGGTAAGVCAAVAAAAHGAAVLLVEPGGHLGGMTSGGLSYTDIGDLRAIAGAAQRLRTAVAEHYGVAPGRFAGPEPHVAEAILVRWLEEAGVEVQLHARVVAADLELGRIRAASFGPGSAPSVPSLEAQAAVFIDASYEGDLLAAVGVPAAVGREDRALHGERFAGRQELVPGRHVMPPWISPFADDPDGFIEGPLLPQIRPQPLAPVGAGDGGVMSYGYRVCLTTATDRIPLSRPDDYDEAHWELGRRLFARWRRDRVDVTAERLLGLEPNLPGGKCDANSLGPFSLSVLDGSAWEYPLASPERREQLRLHHERHARGFLHFLSSDPAVPRHVRDELTRWGLPADEFADTAHFPHQLYVREARRMIGAHVLTEHDVLDARPHDDAVALGSYHLDIREVQRGWRWVYEHPRPVAMVVTEGYLSVPAPRYPIPYRSLTPRREDCENLLVPVCLSASHVAFSSVRMEPQYQMLGEAAGIAAAAAARAGIAVQDVDVRALEGLPLPS